MNNIDLPKSFSIIIPHYNIPNLLIRCLASIPIRDDTEVIIVDDNSSGSDCYQHHFQDLNRPDVKFIRTTDGKGAGFVRNVGLTYATGKWVIFADADDFFVDDFNNILDSYKDSDKDVIYFRNAK